MSSTTTTASTTPREIQLRQALDESQKALGEVVEECVYMETELARHKQTLQQIQEEGGSSAAARSLKQMMQEQQERFMEEKTRLEHELELLRAQQQQQPHDPITIRGHQTNSPPPTTTSTTSDNMLVTVSRVSQLERIAGEERAKREELMEQLVSLSNERDALKLDLQSFRTENFVSREEIETEREQRRAMRDEFERLQRNSEASAREQRASEKRYEALMEEMKQVMRERDDAVSQRDEARFHASELDRAAQVFKLEADEAKAARDGLMDRALAAERARDLALAQRESEERMRVAALADLDTVKQQVGTLVVERDSALRENEWVMKRFDAVQAERRDLAQERTRTAERVDELQRQYEVMESRMKQDARKLQESETTNMELREELDKALRDVSELSAAVVRGRIAVEEIDEHKSQADREIEAARRQVKALNEEMMTVLKARDLALKQRDEFGNTLTRMQGAVADENTALVQSQATEIMQLKRELTSAKQLISDLEIAAARIPPPRQPVPAPIVSIDIVPASIGTTVIELRGILRGTIAELQMDVFGSNAPSPPRLPSIGHHHHQSGPLSSRGSGGGGGVTVDVLDGQLQATVMEARDVATRVGSLRDKLRTAVEAERNASRRVEQLEWKVVRGTRNVDETPELDRLRQRAADLEKDLLAARQQQQRPGSLDARVRNSTVLENENVLLRQDLRTKASELEALKEQREVLYREVESLNLKLQRATPHKNEVDVLRSKLRSALSDLDKAEEELRRLRA